jgi:hypothetical protein
VAICLAWLAGAVWAGSRRRSRSPAYKITPLTVRKMAAGIGLPRTVRNMCSSSRPTMPTGIVARMISQVSRWSAILTWRSRSCDYRPQINVSIRPSSCSNFVGAGGFEPPASRL